MFVVSEMLADDLLSTINLPTFCLNQALCLRNYSSHTCLSTSLLDIRQRGSLMLSRCVTGQSHIAWLGNGTASLLPGCATGRLHIARLGNGTASPLPGYVAGRLQIARLGNGTALILPGCVTLSVTNRCNFTTKLIRPYLDK